MESQVMYIGFDDTDSPKGMCTTYLAYKMVNVLKKEKVAFLDFPNLIRFNPNIPWKTRGNGAVGLSISTNNPQKIKRIIKKLVKTHSDTKNGANPGLVFFEKKDICHIQESCCNYAAYHSTIKNPAIPMFAPYYLRYLRLQK